MTIEEACKEIMDGAWVSGIENYEVNGKIINLKVKSNSGRSTYNAEVMIKGGGKSFVARDPYGSNKPSFFGSHVCQLMTEGKIE